MSEPVTFKDYFRIPHFMLSLTASGAESCQPAAAANWSSVSAAGTQSTLEIRWKNMSPSPLFRQGSGEDKAAVLVLCSPILDGKLDSAGVADMVLKNGGLDDSIARSLDGEFIVIYFNGENDRLEICNDRFASLPLYWRHDPVDRSFLATPYFSDIWGTLKAAGKEKLNQEALFEFLWLQRILGAKTLDSNVFFLPDSSILRMESNKPVISRYWDRNYEKSKKSLRQHAGIMAELTMESVKVKSGDGKRYGHFLSGGLDSRSVLAAFRDRVPVCFTATISENREQRTARTIAETKGAPHVFLKLDDDHYSKILEPAVRIAGGMYNYDHGLFLGYTRAVEERADVCFHGHGYDYMFQGMYIPSSSYTLGGRTLYLKKMIDFPDDIASYFINNASYRIKGADIMEFTAPEKAQELYSSLRDSVEDILTRGRELTEDSNDLWEYLTFHYISRHYSFPNHASIAASAEQRTISFYNKLFDLYLSLPVKHRFDGAIEKASLKILSPEIAKIWSANTNLPATASHLRQTVMQAAGFLKRKFMPEKDVPTWTERTWPSRDHAVRNQPGLRSRLEKILYSGTLDKTGFLDTEKLKKNLPRWAAGENVPGVSGDLAQTLLTTGVFLSQEPFEK